MILYELHSPNFQICNMLYVAFFTVCLCNKLYSKHEIIWFPPDDQTINSDSHSLVCVHFVQFVSTSYILDDTVQSILPEQDYSIQGPGAGPRYSKSILPEPDYSKFCLYKIIPYRGPFQTLSYTRIPYQFS